MQFNHLEFSVALRRLAALVFLIAVALVPFLIVAMYPSQGGIWVAGYVTGIITVPFVAFGAIRAMITLNDEGAFVGTVVYGLIVIVISLTVALWSLFGSLPRL